MRRLSLLILMPSGFLHVQHSARFRPHARVGLLDRSAGSKTDPIEMTVIDRAPVRSIWHGRIHWAFVWLRRWRTNAGFDSKDPQLSLNFKKWGRLNVQIFDFIVGV